jgi:hypothetical protein
MDLDPQDSGKLYDYEAERVFAEHADREQDALERWFTEWFTMGWRELLFYLEKQARFAEYLRETGRA